VFDPYTVLGVSRDASQEDIHAAYQEARLKYDADQVDHLGLELQQHFKAKAQAVERAYQQLTG
jgi:preprotein translocase subunit Sec63